MLYPLSYEGWDKKVLVTGYPRSSCFRPSSDLAALGRGRIGETPTVAVHGVAWLG